MKLKLFSLIIAMLTLLSALPLSAAATDYSVTADGFLYTVENGAATIHGYNGTDTELYMPYSIKYKQELPIKAYTKNDLPEKIQGDHFSVSIYSAMSEREHFNILQS